MRKKRRTLAVHSDGAFRALSNVEEALEDGVAGAAAVDEEQVVVCEAGVGESPRVVDLLVEAHHARHVVLAEVREVRLRGMQRVTWATKKILTSPPCIPSIKYYVVPFTAGTCNLVTKKMCCTLLHNACHQFISEQLAKYNWSHT